MPDREKVMRGLEAHANTIHPCTTNDGTECPYYNEGIAGCSEPLANDALALLKEQEPRVLTTEELTQIEPWTVYWGEGNHVINLWPMAFMAKAIENLDSGFVYDSYGRFYEVELYNKGEMGWRIWTSRPTDDQRKDTTWEEKAE